MNILGDLKLLKSRYKKLIEIFPDDSTYEQYYKKILNSIEKLKEETVNKNKAPH
ncbi:MAG: hypothetical protein KJI71_00490 [Patescibacteria group bacterium]|nr:hypothetical protein [Patescibacteria group bacterium]